MQEYISEVLLKVEKELSQYKWFGGKVPLINIEKYHKDGVSADIAVQKIVSEVYHWEHFAL